jgi:hypothetical protein
MGVMLTKNALRQPTLTQMDLVQPLAKKQPPLPHGWKHNTCEAMGNAFYLHMASGHMVYKFEDMLPRHRRLLSSYFPTILSLLPK